MEGCFVTDICRRNFATSNSHDISTKVSAIHPFLYSQKQCDWYSYDISLKQTSLDRIMVCVILLLRTCTIMYWVDEDNSFFILFSVTIGFEEDNITSGTDKSIITILQDQATIDDSWDAFSLFHIQIGDLLDCCTASKFFVLRHSIILTFLQCCHIEIEDTIYSILCMPLWNISSSLTTREQLAWASDDGFGLKYIDDDDQLCKFLDYVHDPVTNNTAITFQANLLQEQPFAWACDDFALL